MKEIKLPVMFSQVTNNVELRAFAIQIAQNFISNDDSLDTLIERTKVIESYVRGSAELSESPQNQNTMLEDLKQLMEIYSTKKEEEKS